MTESIKILNCADFNVLMADIRFELAEALKDINARIDKIYESETHKVTPIDIEKHKERIASIITNEINFNVPEGFVMNKLKYLTLANVLNHFCPKYALILAGGEQAKDNGLTLDSFIYAIKAIFDISNEEWDRRIQSTNNQAIEEVKKEPEVEPMVDPMIESISSGECGTCGTLLTSL